MKKFISLVLALVMALSLTTIAWGAPVADQAAWDAAIASANSGDTIELGAGTFNLGTLGASAPAELTIVGTTGTVVTYFGVAGGYQGKITVKNCTFEVGSVWCGVCIEGKGTFTFDGCEFVVAAGKDPGSAIYMTAQYTDNEYVIKNCSFSGEYNEAAVVVQKQGAVTDYDVTVSGNDFDDVDGLNVGVWGKDATLNLTSDVAAATMVNSAAGLESAVANAEAGDIIALVGDVTVTTPIAIDKPITIDENGHSLSGMAAGSDVTTDASGKVTGGTFASAPANVADGYEALLTNGAYMVVPKTAADGTITTLKDADKYDIYPVAGTTSVKAANANITKKVVGNAIAADGTVTYTATTYSDGANVYVEVDSAVADYKLVQGNMVVAYMVNLADVGYVPTTTKTVTSYVAAVEKAACGQYSKATYPAGVYMIDGKAYAAGGANWALYNGKFVNYGGVATAVPHTYAVNTYNTTDKSVATLKCSVCKQVFTVLTPAQVKTMAPSAFTVATVGNTDYFIAVATAPVVTPSTDKVTSAETFDAGIAMYVGMSVMAAAGSAVVLKKKD